MLQAVIYFSRMEFSLKAPLSNITKSTNNNNSSMSFFFTAGAVRGKDINTILSDEGKQTEQPIKSQARLARNRKRRRLNDLESDSTAAESEEEFMLSNR